MVLGFLFPQTIFFVEEKREENSTYTANAKMPTIMWKRQPANAKNGGKIMVTWSFLPFKFHVNMMQNFSDNDFIDVSIKI